MDYRNAAATRRSAVLGRLTAYPGMTLTPAGVDLILADLETEMSVGSTAWAFRPEDVTENAPPRPGIAWTAFSDAMPQPGTNRTLLVTNNLRARNVFGFASHVWLVEMVHRHERAVNLHGRELACPGEVTGYSQPSGAHVRNLTHWRYALPEEG